MDREQFFQSILPYLGGSDNISRQVWKGSKLCVTVKDVGTLQLEALEGIDTVASVELDRGRVTVTAQGLENKEETAMANKQKIDYAPLAKQIVANVGGKDNIQAVRHCITRVRFTLVDESIAKDDVIKNLDGVISVVHGGGEYMVVIGAAVVDVFNAVQAELGQAADDSAPAEGKEKKKRGIGALLNLIMGSMIPALDLICASGILKGLLTLLTMFGVLAPESGAYILLDSMGSAVFTFLPIILGYNICKNLDANPYIGFGIGAILCSLSAEIDLFGLKINTSYGSSFLPAIFIIALSVPLSKFLTKHLPKVISGFMVPTLTILITLPIGYIVIAPVANALSVGINMLINTLLGIFPLAAGTLVAGLWQVLVLFGVHGALIGLSFMDLLAGNPQQLLAFTTSPCFAQIGVVLAIYLRTKDTRLKNLCLPSFVSGVFGVTEPAIYGITLPRIKMFVISCIGAATGGAICALGNLVTYSYTGMGVMGLIGMLAPDGSTNMLALVACVVVPFVASLVMGLVTFKDEQ